MKLKVGIPIVKKNSGTWEKYKADGTLEIEFDGSEIDEQQVNTLLQKLDAQFLLIESNQDVNNTIDELKRKLTDTKAQLKTARAQLHRLVKFLESCGVNPRDHVLRFDESLTLRSAEIDSDNDNDNDNDDDDDDDDDDDEWEDD